MGSKPKDQDNKKEFSDETETLLPSEKTVRVDLSVDQPQLIVGQKIGISSRQQTLFASIQVVEGPSAGTTIAIGYLQDKSFLLGRATEADFRIMDPACSRKHAEVFRDANGLFCIKDLGSTAGTRVNGRKIDGTVEIKNQDKIVLGRNVVLVFLTHEPSSAPRPVPLPPQVKFPEVDFLNYVRAELDKAVRIKQSFAVVLIEIQDIATLENSHTRHAVDVLCEELYLRIKTSLRAQRVHHLSSKTIGLTWSGSTQEECRESIENLVGLCHMASFTFEGRVIEFRDNVGISFVLREDVSQVDDIVKKLFDKAQESMLQARRVKTDILSHHYVIQTL